MKKNNLQEEGNKNVKKRQQNKKLRSTQMPFNTKIKMEKRREFNIQILLLIDYKKNETASLLIRQLFEILKERDLCKKLSKIPYS